MATAIALLIVIRLSRGFFRLTPTNLVKYARNIVVLLTDNAYFPTPVPALSIVTAAIDKLDDLIQKALSGDRIMIALRDVARNELLMVLVDLGTYVQGACLNSLAIFITSGFQATKARSTSVVPTTPENARLTQGVESGSLVFQFKKSRNTQSCSIQTASSKWSVGRLRGHEQIEDDPVEPADHGGDLGPGESQRCRRLQRLDGTDLQSGHLNTNNKPSGEAQETKPRGGETFSAVFVFPQAIKKGEAVKRGAEAG